MKIQAPFLLVLAIAMLSITLSCDPKTDPVDPVEKDTFSVAPESISFKAEDTALKFLSITTNGAWTAASSDTWIILDKTAGTGNASLAVSAEVNPGDDRTGSITIKGSKSVTVSVTQTGKHIVNLVANPDPFDGNKRSSTTYQILIYTFADSNKDGVGDFKGIQDRLDYLDRMGVTALWLSPAHPTNSYHAYDVNDYTQLNPLYGGEDAFKALVEAAREKNIGIYMDYVLNHTGDGHAWFKEAVASSTSEYRDYYIFSADPKTDVTAGNIPMLASEGKNAYYEGEWYAAGGKGRYHFHLDWDSDASPRITVTETAENTYTGTSGKYIYFGNGVLKEFKSSGGNAYDLVTDFDSLWGYLVRTSSTSWDPGTKYGVSGRPKVVLGESITLSRSTSSFDPYNIALTGYYHSNFAQSMPDLNYGPVGSAENSPAFQAVAASADKWIRDFGVAGFRLDAVKHIYHNQWSSENPTFLRKWYARCNATYAPLHDGADMFMVGEVLDSHDMEKNYYKGLPSLFEFGFRDRVLNALKNKTGSGFTTGIIGFIKDHKGFNSKAQTSLIIGNHDINRVASELDRNEAKEKQAAAMLLTAEGKPFIFQGDELGYWGDKSKHGDEDIRMPICWDKNGTEVASKGLPNGIDKSMIKGSMSVETKEADAGSLLNVYKTWSELRNTYDALAIGTMSTTSLSGNSIASWYMTSGSQKLLVIHNVSTEPATVSVSDKMDKPIALLGAATADGQSLTLEGNSSVVFKL